MALMNPRAAHNYLKDGYYPTDEATLTFIAQRLKLKAGQHRFLDPCCGEGLALAQLSREIERDERSDIHTFGVELNEDRATLAQSHLTTVLRSNAFDTFIGGSSQSLLFLNPPYGDAVSGQLQEQYRDMNRLEVQFTQRMLPTLKRGGVLVLVVPYTSLSQRFSRFLASRLTEVTVCYAKTDRFKQVVIFGKKADLRGVAHEEERHNTTAQLTAAGEGRLIEDLSFSDYEVSPVNDRQFRFEMIAPDKSQLEEAFNQHQGLWPTFSSQFNHARHQLVPRPLRRLSPWHLSLSLAAGQIAGKVVSNDGQRVLLVKGGTQKVQRISTSIEEGQTVTTKIDQFVPLIRAIELTPGPDFGRIVVIK